MLKRNYYSDNNFYRFLNLLESEMVNVVIIVVIIIIHKTSSNAIFRIACINFPIQISRENIKNAINKQTNFVVFVIEHDKILCIIIFTLNMLTTILFFLI